MKSIPSQTTQAEHNYHKDQRWCYTAELYAELGRNNRDQSLPADSISALPWAGHVTGRRAVIGRW